MFSVIEFIRQSFFKRKTTLTLTNISEKHSYKRNRHTCNASPFDYGVKLVDAVPPLRQEPNVIYYNMDDIIFSISISLSLLRERERIIIINREIHTTLLWPAVYWTVQGYQRSRRRCAHNVACVLRKIRHCVYFCDVSNRVYVTVTTCNILFLMLSC